MKLNTPASSEPLRAGRDALTRGAWEEARRAFEPAAEDGDPDALEGFGWALFWQDDAERGLEAREQAYRGFLDRGDRRSAARVATALALDYVDFGGLAVCSGWLNRARRHLEGLDDDAEWGWIYLWEGHLARAFEHDLEKAEERCRSARKVARQHEMQDLLLLTDALEGLVQVTRGQIEDGMRKLDEATAAAVAGELTDLDGVLATCCFLVHACERVRDWDRAAQWGHRMQSLGKRWNLSSIVASCESEHAASLIGRGAWEAAEQQLKRAIAALESKRPLLVGPAIAQLGELRRRQGRYDEASEIFQRFETLTTSIYGLAAIALEEGDPEHAVDLLDRLKRRAMAEKWVERALMFELLVRAHLRAGDRTAAEEALHELRRIAAAVGTRAIGAIRATAEGVYAAAAGDHSAARTAFEEAIELHERSQAPWDAARTRLDLVHSLRELGRTAFAKQEARSALETFERLGAERDATAATTLLDSLPQLRAAKGKPPSVLTRRELDVLRLVARGLSDKEVATDLGLSEHTVHRHVSNILSKLNLPSRTAAVAQATREGLL